MQKQSNIPAAGDHLLAQSAPTAGKVKTNRRKHGQQERQARQGQSNSYRKMALEGAQCYERTRHLPPLLALWPHELNDDSVQGSRTIVERLQKSLNAERRRGRAGHWCYDINRHMALLAALEGEQQYLAKLQKSPQE